MGIGFVFFISKMQNIKIKLRKRRDSYKILTDS